MKTKRFVSAGPKKPQSAFFLFASDVRKTLPKMSVTETGKKLGELWQNLPQDEKSVYQEKYNQAHSEYTKKLEEFKKTPEYAKEQELKKNAKKSKKTKKEGKKSKKSKNMRGFDIYVESLVAKAEKENRNIKKSELKKEASDVWLKMTAPEKKKFEDAADAYNSKINAANSSDDSLADDDEGSE